MRSLARPRTLAFALVLGKVLRLPASTGPARRAVDSVATMVGELPDFGLEVYLGEWEFAARHHLTASDAQTLTIGELLALAGPERALSSSGCRCRTRRPGARRSCSRRWRARTTGSAPSMC